MKLYSGRVRLAGEIKNEVNKYDLTASEILILRAIHGASENASDPVVDIVETGSVKRTEAQERARLAEIYSGFRGEPGIALVRRLLGVPGVPLPQEYVADAEFSPEEAGEFEAENDEADVPAPPVVRRRIKADESVAA